MKPWHFIGILLPLLGCSHGSPAKDAAYVHKMSETPVTMTPKIVSDNNIKQTNQVIALNHKILLNVPLIKQNPELKYGCEVTSLAMMLQYAGVKTDKMELYQKISKDPDPLKRAPNGDILSWGNPAAGFVGDMTGKHAGYAVFEEPMIMLINGYLPGRGVNLTGKEFDEVLAHLSAGYPVVTWTTGDYRLPDRWESWTHGKEVITTPLDLHAVVVVGYEGNTIFLNDPLSGKKQVRVNKKQFILTWKAMQSRAVSYK